MNEAVETINLSVLRGSTTLNTDCIIYHPPTLSVFGSVSESTQPNGNSSIVGIRVAICENYTDCTTCVQSDPSYCGWCATTASCTLKSQCNNVDDILVTVCPSISLVAPSQGSKEGGTPVVLGGNKY